MSAVLVAGLAGSAAVTIAPVAAHAQTYRDRDDAYYHRDWDDRYYHRDYDDRYHRYWNGHTWVGIGVPGFGIGFYDNSYPYYGYGPYCDSYDYYNGYCSY